MAEEVEKAPESHLAPRRRARSSQAVQDESDNHASHNPQHGTDVSDTPQAMAQGPGIKRIDSQAKVRTGR